MESRNRSTVTEFILLGFTSDHSLQVLLFLIFLLVYVALLGTNILLILSVTFDQRLHNPMYFFLINLSIMNIGGPSAIIPKMLMGFLSGDKSILFEACMAQIFLSSVLGGSEFILLLFMAYDRYVAICKPLMYSSIMSASACTWMIIVTWTVSSITSSVNVLLLCNLSFCGPNIVDHFFCVFASLMRLSCSDTSVLDALTLLGSAFILLIPLLLIILSYYKIIASIKRIRSGRYKAFSSCTSHLIVVTMFYGMTLVMFMRPKVSVDNNRDKIMLAFYVIFFPMLNPVIYSLRNKDVHRAWRKLQRFHSTHFKVL
uniref:Olfactory receptor n=1 Tax=Leptobrachium leishanense TaxID=445787 RepID=A0A8C5M8J1_9ANUR